MGILDRFIQRIGEAAQPPQTNAPLRKGLTEQAAPVSGSPARAVKTLQIYPFGMLSAMNGYKERQSPLTFWTLRRMSYQTPVLSAIINTRVGQVCSFAHPQRDKFQPGYAIRLRDTSRQPNHVEMKEAQRLSDFIYFTGGEVRRRQRPSFRSFLACAARDSLTFDQDCFEVVPDRVGRPAEFLAVDAATIRLANLGLRGDRSIGEGSISSSAPFVQVIDGAIVTEYDWNELSFGVRNPRTDINVAQYGFSETEMLVNIVTAMLYADEYNLTFFSSGSAPKGMVMFKGSITDEALESFKRQWYAQVAGVNNSWRTPVINADDVQYIDLQKSNRDMEYGRYQDYLVRIACAVFLIDPSEINFQGQNGGAQGVTFESKQEQRVKYSRDRGLRPLLTHIEENLNNCVMYPLNEDFELRFEGLNTPSEDEVSASVRQDVSSFMTVNEARQKVNLPALTGEYAKFGNMIMNQNFMMAVQQEEQAKMMEQQGQGQGQGQPSGKPGQGQPEQGEHEEAPDLWDTHPDEFLNMAKSIANAAPLWADKPTTIRGY